MCRLVILFTLVCMANLASSYIVLHGKLAESTGMPMTLHCSVNLGYILIGGITVRNEPMEKKLREKVKAQCERQMKKYEKARMDGNIPQGDGTSCVLSLPRKDVGDDDVVRVVYSCHASKTSGDEKWGEEVNASGGTKIVTKTVTIPASDSTGGQGAGQLTCRKSNEVITVDTIKLDGRDPKPSEHPSLVPQTMSDACFQQWTEFLKGSSKAYYPICDIQNTYGYELKITYVCLGPGQQRKEMGDKNGNGNGNGNGDANDSNGNGNGNGNNGNGNGNGNNGNGNGNGNNGNGNGNGNWNGKK